jgi:hypothetical protein
MKNAMRSYGRRPPVRQAPDRPDQHDQRRIEYGKGLWHSQDDVRRLRDRHVEENIRMICGQQWHQWSSLLQRFLDVNEWMSEDERRWRQRPVVNWILYWYMLTHARLTENSPIITFQPSGPDRYDAMLAETMDQLHKHHWSKAGMLSVNDRLMQQLIPGGEAFGMSRIDRTRGELKPWIGPAMLPLEVPGMGTQEVYAEQVPYNRDGQAQASAIMLPDGQITYELTGEPHYERSGEIVVDVMSGLQVRGEYSPRPWHEKAWHQTFQWYSCEQIYDDFGIEVDPEASAATASGLELQRMLFGAGYYGASGAKMGSDGSLVNMKEGFAGVYALWEKPCQFEGMEESPDTPGGRLLIHTKDKCLFDGPRPASFQYVSPIRRFTFLEIPGRQTGSTPQEALNPVQRSLNRGYAQIFEYKNLCCNPIALVDFHSGIKEGQITNKPGANIRVIRRPGVPAMEYVSPPRLGQDVWTSQDMMVRELMRMAHIEGAEGKAPTTDSSGELAKELRSNADRPYGPVARRNVEEYARLAEDWIPLTAMIYTLEEIIAVAGEDASIATITVYPDILKLGRVNVVPDVESMLPEGRGERQAKVEKMYDKGIFGQPGTPGAVRRYLELFRFPHLGRAAMPGGIHFVTARRELAQLAMGAPAETIPVYDWYDHEVHLAVIEEFMSSPEFLALDPMVQQQFAMHREQHLMIVQAQQQQQLQQQIMLARATGGGKPAPGAGPPA